jgi:hypothetical protein
MLPVATRGTAARHSYMPLFRALGAWLMERRDSRDEPGWVFVVALLTPLVPVVPLVVGLGLAYELVVRIDGRPRLPTYAHWIVAGGLVAAVMVGLIVLAGG